MPCAGLNNCLRKYCAEWDECWENEYSDFQEVPSGIVLPFTDSLTNFENDIYPHSKISNEPDIKETHTFDWALSLQEIDKKYSGVLKPKWK